MVDIQCDELDHQKNSQHHPDLAHQHNRIEIYQQYYLVDIVRVTLNDTALVEVDAYKYYRTYLSYVMMENCSLLEGLNSQGRPFNY